MRLNQRVWLLKCTSGFQKLQAGAGAAKIVVQAIPQKVLADEANNEVTATCAEDGVTLQFTIPDGVKAVDGVRIESKLTL